MVPAVALPPAVPSTVHVTAVFEPVTTAVNCCVWLVTTTAACLGLTLTPAPAPPPLLLPPHAANHRVASRQGRIVRTDLLPILEDPPFQQRGDYAVPTSSSIALSSMTETPSSRALSSLEPASSPATT